MDKVEKDDFIFALNQTLKFYGKEVDRMQTSFWWTACNKKSIGSLKYAFLEYIKVGKYAPRPADILSLADTFREINSRQLPPPPEPTPCPPEIAAAWSWFTKVICCDAKNPMMRRTPPAIDAETQEKYLHIVNHEAHKYGMPDAIPEKHRLKEVWG